jgi:hypothetical protein
MKPSIIAFPRSKAKPLLYRAALAVVALLLTLTARWPAPVARASSAVAPPAPVAVAQDIALLKPTCPPGNLAVTDFASLVVGRWQAGSDETMTMVFDRKGRFEQLYFGNKDFDATQDSGGTYKVEGDKITLTWMVKTDALRPIGQWVGYWQPDSKTLLFPANECQRYGEKAKAMETFTRISD